MLTLKYILKAERLDRVYSGGGDISLQESVPMFLVKEVCGSDGDVRLEQVRNPDYVSVDVSDLEERFREGVLS